MRAATPSSPASARGFLAGVSSHTPHSAPPDGCCLPTPGFVVPPAYVPAETKSRCGFQDAKGSSWGPARARAGPGREQVWGAAAARSWWARAGSTHPGPVSGGASWPLPEAPGSFRERQQMGALVFLRISIF